MCSLLSIVYCILSVYQQSKTDGVYTVHACTRASYTQKKVDNDEV